MTTATPTSGGSIWGTQPIASARPAPTPTRQVGMFERWWRDLPEPDRAILSAAVVAVIPMQLVFAALLLQSA